MYRSILAETATRQKEKSVNPSKLDPDLVREFVRDLAWEMYARSVDSLDLSDVTPLLSLHFPGKTDADLAELADVAVVSSPELTRGGETGFEFVHKSFGEYLAAEHIARVVERVSFKAPDYGGALTWRMTPNEACVELFPALGLRLLAEEVQEMLEPMLGCFEQFSKGTKVRDIVGAKYRKDGIVGILDRLEMLLKLTAEGQSLSTIAQSTLRRIGSPLEAQANYCAGLMIVGTAAARQSGRRDRDTTVLDRHFNGEPFKGAFWRCVAIIQSGGIIIDERLAGRIFRGLYVNSPDAARDYEMDESSMPLHLAELAQIKGFSSIVTPVLRRLLLKREVLKMLLALRQDRDVSGIVASVNEKAKLAYEIVDTEPFVNLFENPRKTVDMPMLYDFPVKRNRSVDESNYEYLSAHILAHGHWFQDEDVGALERAGMWSQAEQNKLSDSDATSELLHLLSKHWTLGDLKIEYFGPQQPFWTAGENEVDRSRECP